MGADGARRPVLDAPRRARGGAQPSGGAGSKPAVHEGGRQEGAGGTEKAPEAEAGAGVGGGEAELVMWGGGAGKGGVVDAPEAVLPVWQEHIGSAGAAAPRGAVGAPRSSKVAARALAGKGGSADAPAEALLGGPRASAAALRQRPPPPVKAPPSPPILPAGASALALAPAEEPRERGGEAREGGEGAVGGAPAWAQAQEGTTLWDAQQQALQAAAAAADRAVGEAGEGEGGGGALDHRRIGGHALTLAALAARRHAARGGGGGQGSARARRRAAAAEAEAEAEAERGGAYWVEAFVGKRCVPASDGGAQGRAGGDERGARGRWVPLDAARGLFDEPLHYSLSGRNLSHLPPSPRRPSRCGSAAERGCGAILGRRGAPADVRIRGVRPRRRRRRRAVGPRPRPRPVVLALSAGGARRGRYVRDWAGLRRWRVRDAGGWLAETLRAVSVVLRGHEFASADERHQRQVDASVPPRPPPSPPAPPQGAERARRAAGAGEAAGGAGAAQGLGALQRPPALLHREAPPPGPGATAPQPRRAPAGATREGA